ncbi:hypothetical protein DPEC_G00123200 [Dallia pectoralis]|uniref:Uncharacterized protein n=1 Tax=Dallia pectoralis TaxID=75939 RepID=A0ACC2GR97_DALPE|nr:hypothetical protein DPEC_G00123200 [Dallia pectoralis]
MPAVIILIFIICAARWLRPKCTVEIIYGSSEGPALSANGPATATARLESAAGNRSTAEPQHFYGRLVVMRSFDVADDGEPREGKGRDPLEEREVRRGQHVSLTDTGKTRGEGGSSCSVAESKPRSK